MKRILALLLALMMVLSTAACTQTTGGAAAPAQTEAKVEAAPAQAATAEKTEAAPAEKISIRIAHSSSEENTYQDVCEAFRDKMTELLGADRVEVVIFPNATVGTETEVTEMLQMGTLEASVFGRHASIDPRLEVMNLPFLYVNDAHAETVLRGEKGADVRKLAYDMLYEKGIVLLGWFESGFREVTSKKLIESLADMKGLLIRTAVTDTLMEAFKAWGASPTTLDFSELYSALQTGVVDAQENPFVQIYQNNFFEVQDYMCITNHAMIPYQIVFSAKAFETYPEDVQAAILEAGAYAADVGGKKNIEQNSKLLSELSQKMTVTNMDDESLATMRKLTEEEVWPQFVSTENGTQQLLDAICALAE